MSLESSSIIQHTHPIYYHTLYLLRKYHVNANCWVSLGNGVGTSVNPGLATGCLKYTAEQIFELTSRYLGMNANALMKSLGRQGVAYGFDGSTTSSFRLAIICSMMLSLFSEIRFA